MSDGHNYERAWQRERLARQHAEQLLEEKTRSLYEKVLELEASQANLAKAQDQLLQSEKLKAIGQLTAGLAHEINNPLSFCLPNLEQLRLHQMELGTLVNALVALSPSAATGAALHNQQQHQAQRQHLAWLLDDSSTLIDELQQGMQRIQEIIKQLYHYSMLGQSAPMQWSVQEIWQQVWQKLPPDAVANITIDQQLCDALLQVHPVEIVTALLNIVDNAVKAGARTLSVSCDCSDTAYVRMQIRDDGQGMSQQTLRQVFEPFFTTRDVGAGRGLGLTVSYSIIRQHDGTIELTSEIGVGTCCTVTLPRRLHSPL